MRDYAQFYEKVCGVKKSRPRQRQLILFSLDDMPPVTADRDEFGGAPRVIRIPDPVGVRELAAAMNVKFYEVIRDLMAFEVFATAESKLDFAIASRVCAQHDIVARPII